MGKSLGDVMAKTGAISTTPQQELNEIQKQEMATQPVIQKLKKSPETSKMREKEVSLGVLVPENIRRAVGSKARERGESNRTFVLRALQKYGIEVPESEFKRNRKF